MKSSTLCAEGNLRPHREDRGIDLEGERAGR